MERKDAVSDFLRKIRLAYIEDQRAKGIRASGRSAASLKEEVTPTGGQILGSHYFDYQKVGRRPGKFPPIEAIIQWLKEKTTFNIPDDRGPGLRSLAFLIARKIARKGTDIFMRKRPGLSIEERTLEARKELITNLSQIKKDEIMESLKKLKKK